MGKDSDQFELPQDVSEPRSRREQIIKAAPPDHVAMRHDGIAKALKGITTVEEVLRVTEE